MKLSIPEEVNNILTIIEKNNYEIYIVGGAVRDLIMGKIVSDWDFTTNAVPEEILKLFTDGFYDNEFGTVGVPSTSGLEPHEITTFRTESSYSDHRRPDDVSWGKSIYEDLQRRDFTINAIALQKINENFKIIDPYKGQDDIKNKIIRAVGNPSERFLEDALRMMRAIRIASQLKFSIDEDTKEAIKTHSTLINKIAKERIRDEFLKIITSTEALHGIVLLRETNLLSQILPELEKGFGVEQKSPERHHIYDVGTHSLKSLEFCKSTNSIVRFATLIHDIGKPQTYKKLDSGVITFYNHEIVGAKIALQIADRLKLSKKDTEKLYKLVRFHQFTVDERQTDSAVRRFITNVGQENIEDMLTLRVADRLGGGAAETSWRLEEFKKRIVEVQKQPFSVRDLKIDGSDVMRELKLKPGPKVGEILGEIYREVVEKKIENNREILLEKLKSL